MCRLVSPPVLLPDPHHFNHAFAPHRTNWTFPSEPTEVQNETVIRTHSRQFPYTPMAPPHSPPPPPRSNPVHFNLISHPLFNPLFSSFQNLPFHRPFSPAPVFPPLPVSQLRCPPPPPSNFTALSSLFSPPLFKPLLSHSTPSPPRFSHSPAPMPSRHPPPPSHRTPSTHLSSLPPPLPSTCRSACLSAR